MSAMVCLDCKSEYVSGTVFCPVCGLRLQGKEKLGFESDDPLVGRCIGERYAILKLIGKGGMGMVYRGLQKNIDRPIAIKVLKQELSSVPEVVRRFLHEAKVASALHHPHVVSLIDFGQTNDDLLYIVMELLNGESLTYMIDEGNLSLHRTLVLMTQICAAMEEAHKRGIIHRDLKPDNIFVTNVGRKDFAKILDFGIAKVLNAHTHLTRTGMVFGSPAYMSPEQARGLNIDARTDIYSLGVTLYEMLSGDLLFKAKDPVALMYKQCTERPVPLLKRDPQVNVPQALDALIVQMLEKDPNLRPQTMADVGMMCETILDIDIDKSDTFFLTPQTSRRKVLTEACIVNQIDTPLERELSGGREIGHMATTPAQAFESTDEISGEFMFDDTVEDATDVNAETASSKAVVDPRVGVQSEIIFPKTSRRPLLMIASLMVALALAAVILYFAFPSDDQQAGETGTDDTRSTETTTTTETSEPANDKGEAPTGDPNEKEASTGVTSLAASSISQTTVQTWEATVVLFTVEITAEPDDAVVYSKANRENLGQVPLEVNLIENAGPFVLKRKNYRNKTVTFADLKPGSNTVILERRRKDPDPRPDPPDPDPEEKGKKSYFNWD